MADAIDGLTSYTLKHLRERWWDDEFNEFLSETLRPRPGNRILDVGCGEGLAEVSIGRLHISQVRLVGVDIVLDKVRQASRTTASHNQRASYAVGDATRLPFRAGAFDSVYCVAVLQHVNDAEAAVAEFARVTADNGRVVAVEPDNVTRYLHSSVPSGRRVFEASNRFFSAVNAGRSAEAGATIGSALPSMFARHGIEPVSVRLFPVANTFLGPPADAVWSSRRAAVTQAMASTGSPEALAAGAAYLDVLEEYRREADSAAGAFVEIQNTLLLATVGQRRG